MKLSIVSNDRTFQPFRRPPNAEIDELNSQQKCLRRMLRLLNSEMVGGALLIKLGYSTYYLKRLN